MQIVGDNLHESSNNLNESKSCFLGKKKTSKYCLMKNLPRVLRINRYVAQSVLVSMKCINTVDSRYHEFQGTH